MRARGRACEERARSERLGARWLLLWIVRARVCACVHVCARVYARARASAKYPARELCRAATRLLGRADVDQQRAELVLEMCQAQRAAEF